MNSDIENYEFLSDLTGQMRIAATQGQWDHLVELEKKCSQRVAEMKAQEATALLNEGMRLRKVALIRKILADDAEIRRHTEPWMAKIQQLMQSASQERRLQQVYLGQ